MPPARLLTFGHGRLDPGEFTRLVTSAGIEHVVDVRRFPGSRANPTAARGEIPRLLTEAGIGYRWDDRLGGRRTLGKAERASSPDTWWQVEAFRAYAAWTRSPAFHLALAELREDTARRATAIMCSESVWWRCHRRLISDVLVLRHGTDVHHLMHDGREVPHSISDGARRDDTLGVVWPAVASADASDQSPR